MQNRVLKMKTMKFLWTSFLLFAISFGVKAQTIQAFADRFMSTEQAEVVKLDKDMLDKAGEAAPDEKELKTLLSNLELVTVIDMSKCKEEDRQAFCDEAKKINDESLPLLMDANENNEHVRIYGVMDAENCKELVVISADIHEPAFVWIKGNLDLQKIRENKDFNLVNLNGVKFP